jgi:formylglycine-generating enzyme required for sulfatase activity
MQGSAWEWVQDCWNGSYTGAPTDGSARTAGDCNYRIIRGGSSGSDAGVLRAANRSRSSAANRTDSFGFRIGRTLLLLNDSNGAPKRP